MNEWWLCDRGHFAAVAKIAKSEGLGIELQAFRDPAYLGVCPRGIAQQLRELDGITARRVHAPYRELFPGSADRLARGLARRRFRWAAEVAGRLGARSMVVHHHCIPMLTAPKAYWTRAVDFWNDFLFDHPPEIEILLENTFETCPSMLVDLIDAIELPTDSEYRIGVALDLGHIHCHAQIGVIEWIERLGSRIRTVHLHDNEGGTDDHRALGEGTIPLIEVFAALRQHAPQASGTIEVRVEAIRRSLAWLAGHGLRSSPATPLAG